MNPLKLWLNPWVLLALVAALMGVYGLGRTQGGAAGENRVQTRWDADREKQRLQLDADNGKSRTAGETLAKEQEDRRKNDAKEIERLGVELAVAVDRLSKRPARPAAALPAAGTACPVAEGGGTGAGLYSDDAVFLARKADLWERIRMQRDECYAAYDAAREALKALNLSAPTTGAKGATPAPAEASAF